PQARRCWPGLLAAALLLAGLALIRQAGALLSVGFAVQMAMQTWRKQVPWLRALLFTLVLGSPAAAAVTALAFLDRRAAGQEGTWSHLDVVLRAPVEVPADGPRDSLLAQCLEGARLRISEVGRLTIPG